MLTDPDHNKQRILLIGSCPPPYGGVTIHIQRLRESFSKRGISTIIFDPIIFNNYIHQLDFRKVFSEIKLLFNKNVPICHIHMSGFNLMKIVFCILPLKCLNYNIVVTFHSLREDIKQFNRLKKSFAKVIFILISHCIVVSPQISDEIQNICDPKKITIIPAFIPPIVKQKDIDEIPSEIWNFIEQHTPIISANASQIAFFKGYDLYGIDMCIDLCINLKNSYPNIGFVFCLPTIGDKKYFEKLKQKIIVNGIENNFLFITEKYNFYPILMKSQIFVRPTNTDGDSISIREAIHFKVPVVTSDVINRPTGSILFLNRDIDDLTQKTMNSLKDYDNFKHNLSKCGHEDNFEKIMKISEIFGRK